MYLYIAYRDSSLVLTNATKMVFGKVRPWTWRKEGKADEYLKKAVDAGHDAVIVSLEDVEFEKTFLQKSKKNDTIIEKPQAKNFDDLPVDSFLIDDETGEIDEMYMFRDLNEQCLKCKKACKQSSMATIVRCPVYVATA